MSSNHVPIFGAGGLAQATRLRVTFDQVAAALDCRPLKDPSGCSRRQEHLQ